MSSRPGPVLMDLDTNQSGGFLSMAQQGLGSVPLSPHCKPLKQALSWRHLTKEEVEPLIGSQ